MKEDTVQRQQHLSETTWETLVEHYKELAARADARIDELRQSTEHWHDTAQMLKRQRDIAEEERDSWKIRAMKVKQERQALRAERDALRNYVEEKLNITKLTRLRGEELDRYILALVNAEANCEALHTINTNLRDQLVLAEGQRDQAKADAEYWKGQHALTFNLLGGLRVECESLRKDREEAMGALAFTGETSLWQAASAANQEVGHLKAERDALRELAKAECDSNDALRQDAARLDWLADEPAFEGFGDSPLDVYELESVVAEQNGRSEPTQADRREGFRRMITAAMAVQQTTTSTETTT